MRSVMGGVGLAAVAVLGLAAPASAAPASVDHSVYNGVSADAGWSSGDATHVVFTGVFVSRTRTESFVTLYQQEATLDANQQVVQETDTVVSATEGVEVTIDSARLTVAHAGGSGLTAERCTYDGQGNQLGACTHPTVSFDVTWSASGPATRSVQTGRQLGDGVTVFVGSDNSTSRPATAVATIAGLAPLGTFTGGWLMRSTQTRILVCLPGVCG